MLAQPFDEGARKATVEDHHREQHEAVGEEDRGRFAPIALSPLLSVARMKTPIITPTDHRRPC